MFSYSRTISLLQKVPSYNKVYATQTAPDILRIFQRDSDRPLSAHQGDSLLSSILTGRSGKNCELETMCTTCLLRHNLNSLL
jgi:hypothetical protein